MAVRLVTPRVLGFLVLWARVLTGHTLTFPCAALGLWMLQKAAWTAGLNETSSWHPTSWYQAPLFHGGQGEGGGTRSPQRRGRDRAQQQESLGNVAEERNTCSFPACCPPEAGGSGGHRPW